MKRNFSCDTLGDSTLIISTDKEDVDVIRHLHLILSHILYLIILNVITLSYINFNSVNVHLIKCY